MTRSLLPLLVLLTAPPFAAAHSLDHGFDPVKDADKFQLLLSPYGTGPNRTVEYVPGGVRLRITPNKTPGHVGVARYGCRLAGDFQVEIKYAIETFPDFITEGYGATLGVYVAIDDAEGGVSVSRGYWSDQGPRYHADRSIPRPKGTHYAVRSYPATARHGRLAIRRLGTEVVLLVADSPDGELRELSRYPISEKPAGGIGLYADPGGASVEMAAKLYDLRVTTGAGVPRTSPPAGLEEVVVNDLPPGFAKRADRAAGGNTEPAADAEETNGSGHAPVRSYWWLVGFAFVAGLVSGVALNRWILPHTLARPA